MPTTIKLDGEIYTIPDSYPLAYSQKAVDEIMEELERKKQNKEKIDIWKELKPLKNEDETPKDS